MYLLSESRKAGFPEIVDCTMSNVAISTRLHQKPQRFFWSGLQTYHDIIQLLTSVKQGEHPVISPSARYDLFAYSIGGLLAQVMMMTDYAGYFSGSRLCLFCGGNVFNRFTPVSRYIIDSEANVALYSYIIEHLGSHLRRDEWLQHFLSPLHPEGLNFNAMLNYNKLITERESALNRVGSRIMAIALEKDRVAPPFEITATLKGIRGNLLPDVVLEDMDYNYIHENPFPVNPELEQVVDVAFQRILGRIARFFSD
jgi:pimeloyl-ACP methyl ester carboxylesterase